MKTNDIIELTPTKEDRIKGARYASWTLPWTFNRMATNTSSKGQNQRAWNIAKGIVAQEVMYRYLKSLNIPVKLESKSYRDGDLFDFRIGKDAEPIDIDLKTIHHYSDYQNTGREKLTKDFIVKHAAYRGPDWRTFLPLLIPHTQINQEKDVYVFGISSSRDFRADNPALEGDVLTAFPYGEALKFLSSKRLCMKREENKKGIYIALSYSSQSMFGPSAVEMNILGECEGKAVTKTVILTKNRSGKEIGPFSMVTSFQMAAATIRDMDGTIEVSISNNEYDDAVLNTIKVNENVPYPEPLVLTGKDFCDLMLPDDYKIYMLGWIPKADFLTKCRKYKGWVWPNDKIDKFCNQPWKQVTEKDQKNLSKGGFLDAIPVKGHSINAGWLKTTGKGAGACCYVFPNLGRGGGVRENNLYVLPEDLYNFETLESII